MTCHVGKIDDVALNLWEERGIEFMGTKLSLHGYQNFETRMTLSWDVSRFIFTLSSSSTGHLDETFNW